MLTISQKTALDIVGPAFLPFEETEGLSSYDYCCFLPEEAET
jgi:hypothetical protein